MTENRRDRVYVNPVRDSLSSERMAKRMKPFERKPCRSTVSLQPIVRITWAHGRSIPSGKKPARIMPLIPAEFFLSLLIFPQKLHKLKNLSVAKTEVELKGAKYLVSGLIEYFSLNRKWVEPYAYTTNDVVSSYKQKWWDDKGNEHEMKVTSYITKVHDVYGHWAYSATVKGGLFMIDTKNNKVVAKYEGEETDDKTSDAYLHLVDAFYSVVKKNLK